MTAPPRVVLDTNVVLSALLFAQGRLAPLRPAWQLGRCHPLVSAATSLELARTLAYRKFRLSPDDQGELLADYLPYCATVRVPARLPKLPKCRDPFDVPFLQLAVAGHADLLVTGDGDLLALAGDFPVPIITGEALLARPGLRA